LSPQIYHNPRVRGGPPNFFLVGILIFWLLRSPFKNLKPYDYLGASLTDIVILFVLYVLLSS
jgi:hypothetical protein